MYVIVLKRQSLPLLATPDATLPQQEKNTRQMSRGAESLDIGPGTRTWPF
jgi:hypothetical protein